MNVASAALTVVLSTLLLALPRRCAAFPLIVGAAYVSRDAVLAIGPADFTVLRILVAAGILRVVLRGERPRWHAIDRAVLAWAALMLATSVFHTTNTFVFRAGVLWTELGCYFLFRVFMRDRDDVVRVFRFLCFAILPVALLMIVEKTTETNAFAIFGGDAGTILRNEHVRARGPFTHPILAGTVGATCFGIAASLWFTDRVAATTGMAAGAAIVLAASSSGPIVMTFTIVIAIALWMARGQIRSMLVLSAVGLVVLQLVMRDPVYFLMARVDLSGGSQSWHRARLIQSALEHLGEWWLVGTDYTRHWMPTGIPANDVHTDITNHFLQMGVMGGLPVVIAFIVVLVLAFRGVGRALRLPANAPVARRFLAWVLGATLFGHVTHMLSLSLFDQSVAFLHLLLAAIVGMQAAGRPVRAAVPRLRRSRAARFGLAGSNGARP